MDGPESQRIETVEVEPLETTPLEGPARFERRPARRLPLLGILIALWVIVYALDVWGRDFWTENEARYALGARSVLRGEWVVPRIAGPIRADKPPLFFWYVAAFSAPLGGVSEWSVRLANLTVAFLALGALYFFGWLHGTRWLGLLAAVMTATTYEFWQQSTRPGVDMLLTALLAVAWVALYILLTRGFSWWRWSVLWGALGLAFLTKGPLAFILVGLSAFAFVLWQFGWPEGGRRLLALRPVPGVAIACTPFVLWALLVLLFEGFRPLWDTVIRQNVIRFVDAFDHEKGWYYYLYELPIATLPWSLLLPLVVLDWKRTWRERTEDEKRPLAFALSIVATTVLFLSFSSSKRDYYLLPILPWFALVLGASLWHYVCETAPARKVAPEECGDWAFVARLRALRLGQAVLAVFGATVLGMVIYSGIVSHLLESRKSYRPMAKAIDETVSPGERLVFIDDRNLQLYFYLQSPFDLADDTPEGLAALRAIVDEGQGVNMVIDAGDLKFLSALRRPLYYEKTITAHDGDQFFVVTDVARPGLQRLTFGS